MSNTTSHRELDEGIEQLVREHIATIHQIAREALDRAFVSATPAPQSRRRAAPQPGAARVAKGGKRRAPAEVSALGEQLYQAVCAHPGEGMVVLARELGASARELHRPMALLKQAGRVRSIGQRHQTRYFPKTSTAS
jgi:hypothetical protein